MHLEFKIPQNWYNVRIERQKSNKAGTTIIFRASNA